MLNIYLFIELLGGTDAAAAADRIRASNPTPCQVVHAVKLNDAKIVAQVDCPTEADGNAAVLARIARVEGVVQTNIVSVVRPRR